MTTDTLRFVLELADKPSSLRRFLDDLHPDIKLEVHGLVALAQEAREQLPGSRIPTDRSEFGAWKPREWSAYLQDGRGFTEEYVISKPLSSYLPMGLATASLFLMMTDPHAISLAAFRASLHPE